MNDNELFELCKEVYEKTGWRDTKDSVGDVLQESIGNNAHWLRQEVPTDVFEGIALEEGYELVCPLYTSDYLLEKLPRKVYEGDNWIAVHDVLGFDDLPLWTAEYTDGDEKAANGKFDTRLLDLVGRDETPLKAILKLTLELHKKGLLDAKGS